MLPDAAARHYRAQQRRTMATLLLTRKTWRDMTADFDSSWRRIGQKLTVLVTAGQLGAARQGRDYVPDVLEETGQPDRPVARVVPEALAGVASDGRELEPLLYGAVTRAKEASRSGDLSPSQALDVGENWLDMAVQTALADADRAAVQAGIIARPDVKGYVRMLNLPSCSRCVVLAGKWYRANEGFLRHPRCDCRHIPASEGMARDLTTDPKAYFASLGPAEQDRVFTTAGAQAIRDGSSIGSVVNARRGNKGLATGGRHLTADELRALRGGRERGHLQSTRVAGRDLYLTGEGTTVRGVAGKILAERAGTTKTGRDRYRSAKAPRLMPESIYQIAGTDRDEAIRLLRLNGYLT